MPHFHQSAAHRFWVQLPFQSPISLLSGFRRATLASYWNNSGITYHLLWSGNHISYKQNGVSFMLSLPKMLSPSPVCSDICDGNLFAGTWTYDHLKLLTRMPQPLEIFPLSSFGMLSLSKIGSTPLALHRRHFEPETAFIFLPTNCSQIVKQKWNIQNKMSESANEFVSFFQFNRFSIFYCLFLTRK